MNNNLDDSSKLKFPKSRSFKNVKIKVNNHFYQKYVKSCTKSKTSHLPDTSTIKKYILPGNDPFTSSMLKNDDLVLPYRLFIKKQEREKFDKRLGIGICDKYKTRSVDLKKRLYVGEFSDNVTAITNIDENFFTFVNGHQTTNCRNYFKTAKSQINDQLRLNLEISLRNDCILQIETDQRKQLHVYNKTVEHCIQQSRQFDTFISEDYKKSIFDLEKWEDLQSKLKAKINELETLASQSFTIMSRLIGLENRFSIQQMYGRFLYYLSPPVWRAHHRDFARSLEIEAEGFEREFYNEGDTFATFFEKIKSEICSNPIKPVLYFDRAEELIDVFIGIEKQQLNHFRYVTHVTPYIHSLKKSLKKIRSKIALETVWEKSLIEGMQELINFYEENCDMLQAKFFRVLNGLFYESIGAPDVIKLKFHLEFCYMKVFNESLMNSDLLSLAKAIEKSYFDYSKKFETFSGHRVQQAVKENFRLEKEKMKQAYKAQSELRSFNRLEKELNIAFSNNEKNETTSLPPIFKPSKKHLKSFTKTKESQINKLRSITESEKEYLKLFTNWVENEDPANYLHSFSNEDKES